MSVLFIATPGHTQSINLVFLTLTLSNDLLAGFAHDPKRINARCQVFLKIKSDFEQNLYSP